MDASAEDPVRLTQPRPGVALITLHRPERLNALNMEVKRRIEAALNELAADAAVRVVVLTGGPKVFVAGTDIAEVREMSAADHAVLGTNRMFLSLREMPQPLIAAVEGYALGGGCELALNCDMIVAAESARFGQPEIRVGIMPGAGGTQILMRALGRHRAMRLCLTGEQISAREALGLGLVSTVTADGGALDEALSLADTICGMPPLAVQRVKAAMRAGEDLPLSEALAEERRVFVELFDTWDQKEGMAAFLEKRRPAYEGR